jgi:hypothetical protein
MLQPPLHLPLLSLLFFVLFLLLIAGAAEQGVTLSIALDHVRSNFSAGACDGMGGGAHIFVDHPLLHFPTVFFWMKFHDELGSGTGVSTAGDNLCSDNSCSSREGSSFYLPLDSTGGNSGISLSRKMTLSIEQELQDDSGSASVVPLYSIMYNTNWDGRSVGVSSDDDEWVMMRWGQQPGVPVGKAQDLPVSLRIEDLMAMPQWPQMAAVKNGFVTSDPVKLFYLLEFDVRVGSSGSTASPDGLSIEHVILSLELHACAHADWRSPWVSSSGGSSSSSNTGENHFVPQSAVHPAADLPAAGLRHVVGGDVEGGGGEGQWSHYKCSAGKQWFDDAEVGSASSAGMHAESARHMNRSPPLPPRAQTMANCNPAQACVCVLRSLHDAARCFLNL